MRQLAIKHLTRHSYEQAVAFGDHCLYLRPFDAPKCRVSKFEVRTSPGSAQRWVSDSYGNAALICGFEGKVSSELQIEAEIRVDQDADNPFDFILDPEAVAYPFSYGLRDARALMPYLEKRAKPGELRVLNWFYHAVPEPVQHSSVVQFLIDLCVAIRRDISYQARLEEGIYSPDETLELRAGSCRDMAALFISIVRQLGLAARFVSGYLYDPPLDLQGGHFYNRAVGAMHAWADVYLPGAGWKGFDPTNGIMANQNFLPCAASDDPLAVSPIRGAYISNEGVNSTMSVDLEIEEV